jgi:hypothetical protein
VHTLTPLRSRVRVRRTPKVLLGALGLAAMAIPLAQAGSAAAATLSDSPSSSTSFNGRVDEFAYSGNTLYVVGEFTQATDNGVTVTRSHAAAIDWTTGHLLPWNPAPNGSVFAIAVDAANGWVYLGGGFGKVQKVTSKHLARVSATGTGVADPTFVHSFDLSIYGMSLGNGRLYVGGAFNTVDGVAQAQAAAFDLPSGTLDPTWVPQLVGGKVHSVVATPTRVYLAGESTTLDGSANASKLGAVDPVTGALDNTFRVRVPYRVFKLDVTPTAIYAAADGNGGHLWSIALNGNENWIVTADGGFQAVTDINGMIVAGGHFDNVCKTPSQGAMGSCQQGQTTRHKFMMVDAATGTLQAWDPNADSPLGDFSLATSPDDSQVAAGGDFTNFKARSISQPHMALFNAS